MGWHVGSRRFVWLRQACPTRQVVANCFIPVATDPLPVKTVSTCSCSPKATLRRYGPTLFLTMWHPVPSPLPPTPLPFLYLTVTSMQPGAAVTCAASALSPLPHLMVHWCRKQGSQRAAVKIKRHTDTASAPSPLTLLKRCWRRKWGSQRAAVEKGSTYRLRAVICTPQLCVFNDLLLQEAWKPESSCEEGQVH